MELLLVSSRLETDDHHLLQTDRVRSGISSQRPGDAAPLNSRLWPGRHYYRRDKEVVQFKKCVRITDTINNCH